MNIIVHSVSSASLQQKISVVKMMRTATGHDLGRAKDLVDKLFVDVADGKTSNILIELREDFLESKDFAEFEKIFTFSLSDPEVLSKQLDKKNEEIRELKSEVDQLRYTTKNLERVLTGNDKIMEIMRRELALKQSIIDELIGVEEGVLTNR